MPVDLDFRIPSRVSYNMEYSSTPYVGMTRKQHGGIGIYTHTNNGTITLES